MYIGTTDLRGLHHLVYEIVDNSIDEAMAGYATRHRHVHQDGSVTVKDNGRGIPVDVTPEKTAERSRRHDHPARRRQVRRRRLQGLRRPAWRRLSVVNALSEWTLVEVTQGRQGLAQEYERGKPPR